MFKLLLCLGLLASIEAKLDLTFNQNSQELDIRCKFQGIENTTIVNVIFLNLSRKVRGKEVVMASVTPFGEPVTDIARDVVLTSSVSLNGSSGLFVNLHWPRATASLDGPYKCELRGLDDLNAPVTFTQNLVVALKNLEPTLLIKPSVIEVGLTQSLDVQCSIKDFTTTQIASVISINMFRMRDGIEQLLATASVLSGVQAISGVDGAGVTGFVSNNQKENYLKLIWSDPSFDQVGDYLCEITALNTGGLPVDLKRGISLTAIDPPRQLLIDRINSLRGEYQKATEEISQIKIDVEDLKNNFTKDTADLVKELHDTDLIFERAAVECPNVVFLKRVCNFENDTCGTVVTNNTHNYYWRRAKGPTASSGTGPDADHTLKNSEGYYLYTEASSGNRGDMTSLVIVVPKSPVRPMCVSFWYNMFGVNMGTLKVFIGDNVDQGSPIWSRSGDQGQGWKEEFINLSPSNVSRSVIFEAIRGYNQESDMAIDDISIYDTACHLQPAL